MLTLNPIAAIALNISCAELLGAGYMILANRRFAQACDVPCELM
jgi:hypothetical protein